MFVALLVVLYLLYRVRKQCWEVCCVHEEPFRVRFYRGCLRCRDDCRFGVRELCIACLPQCCQYCYPPEPKYGDIERFSNVGVLLWTLKKTGLYRYFKHEEHEALHIECCGGCVKGDLPEVLHFRKNVNRIRASRGAHRRLPGSGATPAQFYWDDRKSSPRRLEAGDLDSYIVLLDYDTNEKIDNANRIPPPIRGVTIASGSRVGSDWLLTPGIYARDGDKIVPVLDGAVDERQVLLCDEIEFFTQLEDKIPLGSGEKVGIAFNSTAPILTTASALSPGVYLKSTEGYKQQAADYFSDSVVMLNETLYGDDTSCFGRSRRTSKHSGPAYALQIKPSGADDLRPGLYARDRTGNIVSIPDGLGSEMLRNRPLVVSNFETADLNDMFDEFFSANSKRTPSRSIISKQPTSESSQKRPTVELAIPTAFFGRKGPLILPLKEEDLFGAIIALDVSIGHLRHIHKLYANSLFWSGRRKRPRYCAWQGERLVPVAAHKLLNKTVIVPWEETNGLQAAELYTIASKVKLRKSIKKDKSDLQDAILPAQFYWDERKHARKHHKQYNFSKDRSMGHKRLSITRADDLEDAVVMVDVDVDSDIGDAVKGIAFSSKDSLLPPGKYAKKGGQIVDLPDSAVSGRHVMLSSEIDFFTYVKATFNSTKSLPISDGVGADEGIVPQKPPLAAEIAELPPGLFCHVDGVTKPVSFSNFDDSVVILDTELYGDDSSRLLWSCKRSHRRKRKDGQIIAVRFDPGPTIGFKPGFYGRDESGTIVPLPTDYIEELVSEEAVVAVDWANKPNDDKNSEDLTFSDFDSVTFGNISVGDFGFGSDDEDEDVGTPPEVSSRLTKQLNRNLPVVFYSQRASKFHLVDPAELGNDVIVLDARLGDLETLQRLKAEQIKWDGIGEKPRFCIWYEDKLVPISESHLKGKQIVLPWEDNSMPRSDLLSLSSKLKSVPSNMRRGTLLNVNDLNLPAQFYWDDANGEFDLVGQDKLSESVIFLDFDADNEMSKGSRAHGICFDPASGTDANIVPGVYVRRRGKIEKATDEMLMNRKFRLTRGSDIFSLMGENVQVQSSNSGEVRNKKKRRKQKILNSNLGHGFYINQGESTSSISFAELEDSVVVLDDTLYGEDNHRCHFGISLKFGNTKLPTQAVKFVPGQSVGFRPGLYARTKEGALERVPEEIKRNFLEQRTVIVSEWDSAISTIASETSAVNSAFDFNAVELTESPPSRTMLPPSFFEKSGKSMRCMATAELGNDVIVLDVDADKLGSSGTISAERIVWKGSDSAPKYCAWYDGELVPVDHTELADKNVVIQKRKPHSPKVTSSGNKRKNSKQGAKSSSSSRNSQIEHIINFDSDDDDNRIEETEFFVDERMPKRHVKSPKHDLAADVVTVFEESGVKQKANVFRLPAAVGVDNLVLPPSFFTKAGPSKSCQRLKPNTLSNSIVLLKDTMANVLDKTLLYATIESAELRGVKAGVYVTDGKGKIVRVSADKLNQKSILVVDEHETHSQTKPRRSMRHRKADPVFPDEALSAAFFARCGTHIIPLWQDDVMDDVILLDLDLDMTHASQSTAAPYHMESAKTSTTKQSQRITAERLQVGVGLASWLKAGFYARKNGQPTALSDEDMVNMIIVIMADQGRSTADLVENETFVVDKSEFDDLDIESFT